MKHAFLTAVCTTAAIAAQLHVPHAPAAQREANAEPAYPSRPVRLLVGLPPGGTADLIARTVMPQLGEALGQTIVIDNRTGSPLRASETAAFAARDGYTLLFRTSFTSELVEAVNGKLRYDVLRAFAPVSLVTKLANVLVVNPLLGVTDVAAFVAHARSYPGKLNYGSSGVGSSGHLSMELLKKTARIELVHVPYRGAPQFAAALLSGEIQASFANVPGQIQNIQSGKLRALAVTSMQRNFQLPDTPTMDEAGFRRFEVTVWFGVVAPAGVSEPVLTRLNSELVKTLAAPEVRNSLRKRGADPAPTTRGEFAAFQSAEVARLTPIIREAGIKPQ